jgi:hypothetical protein
VRVPERPTEEQEPADPCLSDAAPNSYAVVMPQWIRERSGHLWLSLAIGVVAAVAALPSFTDPWPSNLGGFVFVVFVVSAFARGAIALGGAFMQGLREPRYPAER